MAARNKTRTNKEAGKHQEDKASKHPFFSSNEQENASGIRNNKVAILICLVILLLFAGIFTAYRFFITPEKLTIDQLHERNLKGKLDPEEGYTYRGFSFVRANNMWFTKIARTGTSDIYNLQFHYGPKEVENITVLGDVKSFLRYNETFITFNPSEKRLSYTALTSGEITINLASVLGILPHAACTKNETRGCSTAAIVNCESTSAPVLSLEITPDPKIITEKNCLRIQGNGTDLLRSADKTLLQWFGIMD